MLFWLEPYYFLFGWLVYQHLHTNPWLKYFDKWITIDSRYIAVIYNTIVHTAKPLQWQNFSHTLQTQNTPHTSPLRASYGVSFVSYSKKNECDISKAHFILYEGRA